MTRGERRHRSERIALRRWMMAFRHESRYSRGIFPALIRLPWIWLVPIGNFKKKHSLHHCRDRCLWGREKREKDHERAKFRNHKREVMRCYTGVFANDTPVLYPQIK